MSEYRDGFELSLSYGGYNRQFRERVWAQRKMAQLPLPPKLKRQVRSRDFDKVEADFIYREIEEPAARQLMRTAPEWAKRMAIEVAKKHDVSAVSMLRNIKFRPLVVARNELFYLVYQKGQEFPDISTTKIGRWFGGRDHSTVVHALASHVEATGLPPIIRPIGHHTKKRPSEESREVLYPSGT